jgi:hypothetical protein
MPPGRRIHHRVGHQKPTEHAQISVFIDDCSDLQGCYVLDRNPHNHAWYHKYIGAAPRGPDGRCFDYKTLRCAPCSGQLDRYFDGP